MIFRIWRGLKIEEIGCTCFDMKKQSREVDVIQESIYLYEGIWASLW